MDKGFNDDELADIMNEIENLEKEFTGETMPVDEAIDEPKQVDTVEEVVSAVEEVTPIVEEPITNVEESESIVENFEEPTAGLEDQLNQTVESTTEMASEEHLKASTESIEPHDTAVLGELTQLPVEEVTGEAAKPFDDNVHHLEVKSIDRHASTTAKAAHSAMSFSVEGDMKLDLSFNISGKVVHLNINENGFELELDGGMKFSIPLEGEKSDKKVA